MCEMVHVLKNSIAKKVGAARFRSLLWFDLSLLPELLRCGEQMASFSLLEDHLRLTLGRTVALAISGRQLDHNPNRFMGLLGRLKSATGKDLGKTAHIMRMTKTIEHTQFVCAREGHSVLSLPVHQTLRNWRKIRHCKIRGTVAADLPGGRGGIGESRTSACNLKLLSRPLGSRNARTCTYLCTSSAQIKLYTLQPSHQSHVQAELCILTPVS